MDQARAASFPNLVAPILETALDAGILMGSDGVVADWNSQAEQTFGWSRAEALGRPLADLIIPLPLRQAHQRGLQRLLSTEGADRFARRLEVTALHRSGHELPVELSISAISLEGETLFLGFLRDISEQKRAEALHLDVARVLTRRALEAELLFRITRLLTDSETLEEALRASIQAIGETVGWPLGHACVAGASTHLTSTGIWHPEGPDAFDAFRQASRHVHVPVAEGSAGSVLDESETHWRSEADWGPEFTRADVARDAGLKSGCWFPISSGGRRLAVLEFFSDRLSPPDADLLRMVRTISEHIGRVFERDAAARRLEERARELRAQAQELRTVQSVAKIGFWRCDLSTQALQWSDEVYELFGLEPTGPSPTLEQFIASLPPEGREKVEAVLDGGNPQETFTYLLPLVRPNGEQRACWTQGRSELDEAGRLIALVGICQDVTEQENAAAQLRQAQKMEVVGQLTGGLAHDFNNLLSVIIGNLDFIEGELDERSPAREFSATALEAALKGAELTQQLLAFSRRQPLAPKIIDLDELVGGMTALVGRTIGEAVTIQVKRSDDLWPAAADPSQVESAILNLVVNARDAMPSGGILTIETANHRGAPDEAAGQSDAERDYVVVAVSDTGEGMSTEVLERAFEPFFTTKGVGGGSGLGLSMIYGFAEQSGGHVRIHTEVGCGTTVRLFLPAAAGQALPNAAAAAPRAHPKGRAETVLVVEDNEEVRRIAVRQLQDLGYLVLEAENGKRALGMVRDNPAIDLLFTDVVMPGGMSGIELVGSARRENPRLKVLYTTGFADAAANSSSGFMGSDRLITKPYRKADLAVLLRETLEAA